VDRFSAASDPSANFTESSLVLRGDDTILKIHLQRDIIAPGPLLQQYYVGLPCARLPPHLLIVAGIRHASVNTACTNQQWGIFLQNLFRFLGWRVTSRHTKQLPGGLCGETSRPIRSCVRVALWQRHKTSSKWEQIIRPLSLIAMELALLHSELPPVLTVLARSN
jgi:hypothetical protein